MGQVESYPATFVSDGVTTLTLWRVDASSQAIPFNRRTNVGLHHLALAVRDAASLRQVFEHVRAYPGASLKMEPGPMRPGSSLDHFICTMPGGLRIEFTARHP